MIKRGTSAATAAMLLMTACGGANESPDATATASNASVSGDAGDEPGAPAATESAQAANESAADDRAGNAGDDVPAEGTADDVTFDGANSSDWCGFAVTLDDRFNALDVDPFDMFAEAPMTELLGLLDQAVGQAPDEIKQDVETTRDAFGEIQDLLARYDYDVVTAFTQEESAFEEIDARLGIEAASDRIDIYNEEVCGISNEPIIIDDGALADAPTGTDLPLDIDLGGSEAEILSQVLADTLGMTTEQAECFVNNLDPEVLAGAATGEINPADFLGAFEVCGISLTDLTIPGG